MPYIYRLLFIVLLFATACTAKPKLIPRAEELGRDRFVAEGKHAAIASPNEEISKVGIEILKKGGNAADAAVAASFAMSVVRPQSSGIGGGGFMLIYDQKQKRAVALDFRETAPGQATALLYQEKAVTDPKVTLEGPLSVAVPGFVAGMWEAYQKYGSHQLSWEQLLDPAIRLAEGGFKVYEHLARSSEQQREVLKTFAASAALFLPEGEPLKVGDTLVQKETAQTLRLIAKGGRDAFYRGAIAERIVDSLRALGGNLSTQDLVRYQVLEREPVIGSYRGYKIVSMPPPSSGGIHVVEILNVLENFPLSQERPQSVTALHWMAEAFRRAYVDRAQFLGDPDFVRVPVKGLTSKHYAKDLAAGIDKNAATPSHLLGRNTNRLSESNSTAHISIVDSDGNAVATTQSVNYLFGSGITVPGTGIVLNDEMDDFVLKPGVANVYGLVGSEANAIAPGKRPLSSMSPTLVFDPKDQLWMVVGSPGGPRIITAVVQAILNVIDFKTDPFSTVAAGRIHHQWLPDEIVYEPETLEERAVVKLTAMGHQLKEVASRGHLGDLQLVMRRKKAKSWMAVSDPRGEGKPAAY